MCGIVGLFLKDKTLEPQLGSMLTDMLITMTDRGPDSAGIAIYGDGDRNTEKLTVQSDTPDTSFDGLDTRLSDVLGVSVSIETKDTHAVLELPERPVVVVKPDGVPDLDSDV